MRKKLHPAPPLEDIDQAFNTQYDESKHAAKLAIQLKIDHFGNIVSVFADLGVTKAVKNYECSTDTDTHLPIACHGVTYGPHKTPIV